MFRPVANTVQVLLQGDMAGGQIENTFYYKFQAGTLVTVGDLNSLLDSFVTRFASAYTELHNPDILFHTAIARDLTLVAGLQVSRDIYPPIQGGNTGDRLPGNSALSVRRRSAYPGRSFRGRVSLGPFPEAATTKDLVDNSFAPRIVEFGLALLTSFARPSGGTFRAATPSFKLGFSNAIASVVFDLILDSMKTRLTGHGA